MALRVEQWLMIGVAGIGLYALYRAVSSQPSGVSPNAQTRIPPSPIPGPGPAPNNVPAPPNPGLPDRPAPIAPPPDVVFGAGGPAQDPNVLSLDNSRAYRGRGEDVTEADLGFLDAVQIFNTGSEARAAGFPEWAITGASKTTRWFYGRYTYPDAQYQKPANIEAMWLTSGPPVRVGSRWSMVDSFGKPLPPSTIGYPPSAFIFQPPALGFYR